MIKQPINRELLIETLSVVSHSGQEEQAIAYVKAFCQQHGIATHQDTYGNVYAVKDSGSGKPFPCVVAHLDTVHQLNFNKEVWYVAESNFDKLAAWDSRTGKLCGLGADDLAGVYLSLELLLTFDHIKAFWPLDEERGTIGTSKCNMEYFNDCALVMQGDRRGRYDLTESISGTPVVSPEFKAAVAPIMANYNRVWAKGMVTDVGELKERGLKVVCMNMSCGYYNPHANDEYVVVSEVEETLHFMQDIITELGSTVWPHVAPVRTYPKYSWSNDQFWDRSYGGAEDRYQGDSLSKRRKFNKKGFNRLGYDQKGKYHKQYDKYGNTFFYSIPYKECRTRADFDAAYIYDNLNGWRKRTDKEKVASNGSEVIIIPPPFTLLSPTPNDIYKNTYNWTEKDGSITIMGMNCNTGEWDEINVPESEFTGVPDDWGQFNETKSATSSSVRCADCAQQMMYDDEQKDYWCFSCEMYSGDMIAGGTEFTPDGELGEDELVAGQQIVSSLSDDDSDDDFDGAFSKLGGWFKSKLMGDA